MGKTSTAATLGGVDVREGGSEFGPVGWKGDPGL